MSQNPHNLSSPEPAQVEPPRFGGIRAGPSLAAALYALLACSAALAFWTWRHPEDLPDELGLAAPGAFLLFLVCFALYRFALVRAGRYRASKAFLQVGIGMMLFTLLLHPMRPRRHVATIELGPLLWDPNPAVRQLAAEVVGYRPEGTRFLHALTQQLDDRDEAVRAQAHATLVKLSGRDLGPPSDPVAVRAWKERYP